MTTRPAQRRRPSISVVVPTKNSARTLAACLASLRAQTVVPEIVVVDNHSDDDTQRIARALADVVLVAGPERCAQRNIGWRTASAPVVAFIDSDMTLEREVLAEAVTALGDDTSLAALVVPERAHGRGFFARCRALEKQLYLGDPDVEALRIVRRDVLCETGGFDESLTAFEDWELHDRVAATKGRIGRTSTGLWHDEGRVSLRAAFAKKRYYGRWLPTARGNALLTRSFVRTSLIAHPTVLARHPVTAVGLGVLKSVEVAGLMLGARQGRRAGQT